MKAKTEHNFGNFNPSDPFGLAAKRAAGVNIDQVHAKEKKPKPHLFFRSGLWVCVPTKGASAGNLGCSPLEAYQYLVADMQANDFERGRGSR